MPEQHNRIVCPQCGSAVQPSQSYCPNCGQTLYYRPELPDDPKPERPWGLGSDPVSSWVIFLIFGIPLAVIGACSLGEAAYGSFQNPQDAGIQVGIPLAVGLFALAILGIAYGILRTRFKRK